MSLPPSPVVLFCSLPWLQTFYCSRAPRFRTEKVGVGVSGPSTAVLIEGTHGAYFASGTTNIEFKPCTSFVSFHLPEEQLGVTSPIRQTVDCRRLNPGYNSHFVSGWAGFRTVNSATRMQAKCANVMADHNISSSYERVKHSPILFRTSMSFWVGLWWVHAAFRASLSLAHSSPG